MKSLHAVLTGDIVDSTKLAPPMEEKLLKELRRILQAYRFEFFRGDSFQVYIQDPVKSLQVALSCRTAARGIAAGNSSQYSDIRISIGIGGVAAPVENLGSAKGEAFLLSGRTFDEMQASGSRLSIVSQDPIANIGFEVMADYINAIYKEMTAKQAEVIHELLKGEKQQKVAAELDKSKSTISQIVHAGRWPEIEKLMLQYEKLIHNLLNPRI